MPLSCRRIAASVVALALVACSAVAPAQTTPPVVPPPPVTAPPRAQDNIVDQLFLFDMQSTGNIVRQKRQYESATTFMRCVGRLGAATLPDFLRTSAGTSAEVRGARGLAQRFRGCAIGSGYVPVIFLRGATAEVLLTRSAMPSAPLLARTLDIERYQRFEQSSGTAATTPDSTIVAKLRTASRCHVVFAPGLVQQIMGAPAGSEKEREALDAVHAAAPVCAGGFAPKRVSVLIQRALLAEALYHWQRSDGEGIAEIAALHGRADRTPIEQRKSVRHAEG